MRMRLWRGIGAILVLLSFAISALAHHSFVAEFDGSKKFSVKGKLTRLQWTNPHVFIFVDVTDDSGQVTTYQFASGPPSTLHVAGVRQSDFKVGDTVQVTGAPAKDGTKHLGWLQMIKYSDGHVFVYRNASE